MTDPKSPAAGEGGEHQDLCLYVNGCFDVGAVKLEGWTLISNNDLALLKAGAPVPAAKDPLEPTLTHDDVAWLRVAIDEAAQWRGQYVNRGSPESEAYLEEFDARISRMRDAWAKVKRIKTWQGPAKKGKK